MAASRPFGSREAIGVAGDAICATLDRTDWLEAFAAHPRIGEREAAAATTAAGQAKHATAAWSAHEQSGVTDQSRDRFAALNRDYEARFGFTFIVCAAGKRADEMLDLLERRIGNNSQDELREAAEQQRQIMHVRLTKLMADNATSE